MRSFILSAIAGAATAVTTMENMTLINVASDNTIKNKASTPVTLGTVAVNSGWSKIGTGTDTLMNLKIELVATKTAADNLTDNSSTWYIAMSKDVTTASTEVMKISFANTSSTKTMTCSSGNITTFAAEKIVDAKAVHATATALKT